MLVLTPALPWLQGEVTRHGRSPIVAALEEAQLVANERSYSLDRPQLAAADLEAAAPRAAILATYNARSRPALVELARSLRGRGLRVLHLALGWPGDIPSELVDASVAVYGCGYDAVLMGARALTGKLKPRGSLPIAPDRL